MASRNVKVIRLTISVLVVLFLEMMDPSCCESPTQAPAVTVNCAENCTYCAKNETVCAQLESESCPSLDIDKRGTFEYTLLLLPLPLQVSLTTNNIVSLIIKQTATVYYHKFRPIV